MERAELRKRVEASGCACERHGALFLVDPAWSASERAQAETLMAAPPAAALHDGWLAVRTGGSGGTVKFARHDEATLGAAVRGFCEHFGLSRVNAVDVLPWTHVSGLMAAVRCAVTGGRHVRWSWKQLEAGDAPALEPAGEWVLSLVPTQLQRLLASGHGVDWLRRFRAIFIGGGPMWPALADAARRERLPLAVTYGMTETAAMVAATRPEEFLAGVDGCGTPLPHAQVTITPDGRVRIAGDSLFRGYWPDASTEREFTTEDLGEIGADGRLRIFGRRDAVIISGGKKIAPADVEAALLGSGEFSDVAVIGVPDAEWGEAVVACYPAASRRAPDLARAMAGLSPVQRPKRFVALAEWPRTPQGKINRAALLAAVR